MKLYKVTNGFIGSSYVHCLVVAPNENRARELAAEEFKKNARNESYDYQIKIRKEVGMDTNFVQKYNYPEEYWTELDVICISENTDEEYVSEVKD